MGTILIRRENFRGKYYLVVRNNGKIESMRSYSTKESVKVARVRYKQTGSIIKGVTRQRLTNVSEYTDTSKKPYLPPRREKYVRHIIKYRTRKGGKVKTVVGQTKSFKGNRELAARREEAKGWAYSMLSLKETGEYEKDRGLSIARRLYRRKLLVEKSVVVYYK